MQLYQTQAQSLVELIEDPFRLEREIQSLFESNLYSFTGLEFIKSEFTIKTGFRSRKSGLRNYRIQA